MGRLDKLQWIKNEISDHEKEISKLATLQMQLESAKQLNARELMEKYLKGDCETVRPREVKSIKFPTSYCATKDQVCLFAKTFAVLYEQNEEPVIYINIV